MQQELRNFQKRRRQEGETLVGLLVAMIIFSFVAAAIMGLMSVNVTETAKLTSRTDNITAARFGMDKLGRLVRMGRNLGDVQGSVPLTSSNYSNAPNGPTGDYFTALQGDTGPTQDQINDGTLALKSARFPENANPEYGANGAGGAAAPGYGTFVGSAWGAGGPLTLSEDCLIVQVPVFDQNGWPRSYNPGGAGQNVATLDNYVFRVVPDPGRTAQENGEVNYFALQVCIYPSRSGFTNTPAGLQPGVPYTIMSGLVGPLDPADPTRCAAFAYVNQDPNYTPVAGQSNQIQTVFGGATALGLANQENISSFKGVIANFQIMSRDAARRVTVMPLRTEMYLRNNQQATMMGPPPA